MQAGCDGRVFEQSFVQDMLGSEGRGRIHGLAWIRSPDMLQVLTGKKRGNVESLPIRSWKRPTPRPTDFPTDSLASIH